MINITYSFPLRVPDHIVPTPKAKRRFDSGFSASMTLDEALQYFEEEAKAFPDDTKIELFSNYQHIGQPKLRKKLDEHVGVCCAISYNRKQYFIYCDCWGLTEHNLYAIHLTLRAILQMVRWGTVTLESILQPFSAIQYVPHSQDNNTTPSDDSTGTFQSKWMKVLGLDRRDTVETANANYRRLAKEVQNDADKLLELNNAIEIARKTLPKS